MRSAGDIRLVLAGGDGATHGELLSHLCFDPVFPRAPAARGAADARRALAAAGDGVPRRFGEPERPLAGTAA
jgi:hypothetical protein